MFSKQQWLIGTMLAAFIAGGSASEPRTPVALDALSTRNTYMVVYQRGSGWHEGKPLQEQAAMREHFAYYLELHRKGLLVGAGGFDDGSGGAAIFEAPDDEAAADTVAADPAVRSGTFRYEVRRWKPVPWKDISAKRAARGE